MSIQIITENFTEAEREAIGIFEQRFRKVANDEHLKDWLAMIPGLVAMSNAAKAYANTD